MPVESMVRGSSGRELRQPSRRNTANQGAKPGFLRARILAARIAAARRECLDDIVTTPYNDAGEIGERHSNRRSRRIRRNELDGWSAEGTLLDTRIEPIPLPSRHDELCLQGREHLLSHFLKVLKPAGVRNT
jgi:hypothetical protein